MSAETRSLLIALGCVFGWPAALAMIWILGAILSEIADWFTRRQHAQADEAARRRAFAPPSPRKPSGRVMP